MKMIRAWFWGFLSGTALTAIVCAVGFALGYYHVVSSRLGAAAAVLAVVVLGLAVAALVAYIQLCRGMTWQTRRPR